MAYVHTAARAEISNKAVASQSQAHVMLKIIAGVICLGLVLVTFGKLTGVGVELTQNGAAIATHQVTMMLGADDSVALKSVETGAVIAGFDKGHGGFLRNAIRAFGLKRNQMDILPQTPFVVTRWESGRVTLNDPATNHQVPVDSFGPMVTKMFAPLVEKKLARTSGSNFQNGNLKGG